MRFIFSFLILALPYSAWSDRGADQVRVESNSDGYLLITIRRFAFQNADFEPADPPIKETRRSSSMRFALEINDRLREQLDGTRLTLLTAIDASDESPDFSVRYIWMIRQDQQRRLSISGWASGFDSVLGHTIPVVNPNFAMRFRNWREIDLRMGLDFKRDLSGSNVSFGFEFVEKGNSKLSEAVKISANPVDARDQSTLRKERFRECGADLGTFSAYAYFQRDRTHRKP